MVHAIGNSMGGGSPARTVLPKGRQSEAREQGAVEPSYRDSVSISASSVSMAENASFSAVYGKEMAQGSGSLDINKTIKDYVVNLLKQQGIEVKFAIDPENEIDFTAMSAEEARDLVSEDGYFGVNKTSDRIVRFATGIWGNDSTRVEDIKDAVMEGFKQAEKAFGGTLPDISYDTIDAVIEKLDSWASDDENAGAAATVS